MVSTHGNFIAEFNNSFTADEVQSHINRLKNNKAAGIDLILNECLKNSSTSVVQAITKLFNVILDSGKVPSDWTIGLIKPIYKKRGSLNDPNNYRGISLLSCLGKLFTSIINDRLTSYFNDNNLIGQEQAGFRENHSTIDHIFVLHSVIDLYLSQKRRVYCAFIDYRKAFDTIDRTCLWYKMISNNIDGKLFRVIQNMYNDAKSCVINGCERSDFFNCNIGVRQGENLSPFLFALYINDFELFIRQRFQGVDVLPPDLKSSLLEDGIDVYLKLFSLLYADDTIVLAESESDLQLALNAISDYCQMWSLSVNVDKTKVVIFSRGKVRKHVTFRFNDKVIDVVDDYVYLGTTFNYRGDFKKALSKQVSQARRAMYSLIIKAKKLRLPIDIELEMFDRLVVPILLYGCEVWGFSNIKQIESFHIQYCKRLLKLNKNTANCMALGELGRSQLSDVVSQRMINFWLRTLVGGEYKLSTIMCNILKMLSDNDIYVSPWIKKVKEILNMLGLSNIWKDYNKISKEWLKSTLKLRLKDIHFQNWHDMTNNNSLCLNYRIFKTLPELEFYQKNLSLCHRISLAKFRCGNHRLPVVSGRYSHTDLQNRLCYLCNERKIGDEFHYLFECKVFINERKLYLKRKYRIRPNTSKMHSLFNSTSIDELVRLAKFCKIIMLRF